MSWRNSFGLGSGDVEMVFGQREDLIEGRAKNDQAESDQFPAGGGEGGLVEVECVSDGGVGVIRQPLGISDGDEEEIEDEGLLATAVEITVAEKPLIDPTKLPGDLPQAVRT